MDMGISIGVSVIKLDPLVDYPVSLVTFSTLVLRSMLVETMVIEEGTVLIVDNVLLVQVGHIIPLVGCICYVLIASNQDYLSVVSRIC